MQELLEEDEEAELKPRDLFKKGVTKNGNSHFDTDEDPSSYSDDLESRKYKGMVTR
jgi:hypothetical protein